MRRLMILVLLASVPAPIVALPQDRDEDARPTRVDRSDGRPSRADRSVSRPARVERDEPRPVRVEREPPSDRASWSGGDRQERPLRRDRSAVSTDAAPDSVRDWRPRDTAVAPAPTNRDPGSSLTRQPRDGDVADRRFRRVLDRRTGTAEGAERDRRRRDGLWSDIARETLVVSREPRPGTQPPLRTDRRRTDWGSRWDRGWRDDHRYDWRRHRDRHRSTFRIGFYYDPFGWNYRRYNVGWRMWPSYYSRNYWLGDPSMYRLPIAYPGTQWIRYHGDAILVDTWTGEVIDVIHDFFW